MEVSLCKTCRHSMFVEVQNVPGGSGNRIEIVCLIYPNIFNNLVLGHYRETSPYPHVISCNKYIENK